MLEVALVDEHEPVELLGEHLLFEPLLEHGIEATEAAQVELCDAEPNPLRVACVARVPAAGPVLLGGQRAATPERRTRRGRVTGGERLDRDVRGRLAPIGHDGPREQAPAPCPAIGRSRRGVRSGVRVRVGPGVCARSGVGPGTGGVAAPVPTVARVPFAAAAVGLPGQPEHGDRGIASPRDHRGHRERGAAASPHGGVPPDLPRRVPAVGSRPPLSPAEHCSPLAEHWEPEDGSGACPSGSSFGKLTRAVRA